MRVRLTLLVFTCVVAPWGMTATPAGAQSLVDVCSGLSVDLPVLQPVGEATSGLLAGLLDPVLNAIVGDVNVNIGDALSGQNIGLSILDQNGDAVGLADDCNLVADELMIEEDAGIAMGGGRISSLGGQGNPTASAAEINSIAIGNDASTDAAATSSIAIGLRGTVSAVDGVAIGRDASASVEGAIALGAGSLADRSGMNGAAERFSGTAVGSSAGAVSVGSVGNERQITNLAGGTAATDAVNVRQLRSVGDDLASAFGGGAAFDDTTGAFTAPSFDLRSGTYNDVGSALAALDDVVDGFEGDLAALERGIGEVRREAREGIAAAMAMTSAPMPSAPGRTSWAANVAMFKDQLASGFSFAHRLNTRTPIGISASVAVTSSGVPGARAGLMGEF